MAANTKDFRCQKLPNHLQNPHLLRYTLLTVKYTIYSTKGKTMTRIKSEGFIRLFTRFESLGHFSREKNTFWTAKIHEFWRGDAFSQFRIVNQTYLRTKISLKNFMSYTLRDKLNIGKTLRLPENMSKRDHLLLWL